MRRTYVRNEIYTNNRLIGAWARELQMEERVQTWFLIWRRIETVGSRMAIGGSGEVGAVQQRDAFDSAGRKGAPEFCYFGPYGRGIDEAGEEMQPSGLTADHNLFDFIGIGADISRANAYGS